MFQYSKTDIVFTHLSSSYDYEKGRSNHNR